VETGEGFEMKIIHLGNRMNFVIYSKWIGFKYKDHEGILGKTWNIGFFKIILYPKGCGRKEFWKGYK
jgi:hypothetical protein